jgi:hypothetical protein
MSLNGIGPAGLYTRLAATVLFGLYLAGMTILGGLLGKRLATPTSRADRPRGNA